MQHQTACLSTLTYFPPISLLAGWAGRETVFLEAHEHYQKGSYRNRCHLAGPNGLLRLSVPLEKGKHQQTPIREVGIAYRQPWHRQHWQSIRTAYGNAPFWEYYAPDFESILTDPPELLWDLNLALLQAILRALQWNPRLELTEQYTPLLPSLSSPLPHPDQRPLAQVKSDPPFHFPSYPQVFTEKHGFLPNLSILDLLFCQGPAAALYLAQLAEQEE
jgi:hypothetical protein